MKVLHNLTPMEAKEFIEKEKPRVIDVREQWEYDIVHLPDAELLSLSKFNEHMKKLNPNDKLLIYCHHGSRSLQVAHYLSRNGFRYVYNLDGGINAYAEEVDQQLAQY